MFKRGWLRRNWVFSDEGFSVQIAGRDKLVYREGNRRMQVTAEMGSRGYAVFLNSIGRWDDNPENIVGEEKRREIANRIQQALTSQGEEIQLL